MLAIWHKLSINASECRFAHGFRIQGEKVLHECIAPASRRPGANATVTSAWFTKST